MGYYCEAHVVQALREYCQGADEKGVTVRLEGGRCGWCSAPAPFQFSYYPRAK